MLRDLVGFGDVTLAKRLALEKRLHWRPTVAMSPLIRSTLVVANHVHVEVRLNLFERFVDLLAKRDLPELIENDLICI